MSGHHEVSTSTDRTEQDDEKGRLVQELTIAQERLNASRRQYDTVVQELRASNEELQSIYKKYRSTSEELETSTEQLQFLNEELKTVRGSEIRLRQVMETATVGVMFVAANGTIIDSNNAFLTMTGYSRAEVDAGEITWRRLTPIEWVAVTEQQFDKLKGSGLIGPYEKELLRKEGTRCWILLAGRKLDDGTAAVYCMDISARKRAEEERELLASELSHRVKNTLAVVEALASQTTGKSVEEFREKFAGRLRALAQAHTLWVDSDWNSVDLKMLLQQALSAYHVDETERMLLDGVPVAVTPKQALSLRMVVHELATNAVKYGALSNMEGNVYLSWRIEQTGDHQCRVRLCWKEQGGPMVVTPKQTGFGARMIKTASEYDLGGEAQLDYTPQGLVCEIAFPITTRLGSELIRATA